MNERMSERAESRVWTGSARRQRAAAWLLAAAVVAAPVMLVGCRTAWALNTPHGAQGYLGVDIRDVSDEQVSALKLKEARGAEVIRVDHDGPAGKVGLREHDVILEMNSEAVEGQDQLRRMLHETPAGRAVTLVISRDGQQQTLKTQLANREEVERQAWERHLTVPEPNEVSRSPEPTPVAPSGRAGAGPTGLGFLHQGGSTVGHTHKFLGLIGSPYTGALVEPMGPQLAEFFGVKEGMGLLVRSVEANSPAATAGLRAGDVVLKANQTPLASPGDWAKTMHENRGKAVAVTVMRERREQTMTLTPDAKRRSAVEMPVGPGFAELAGVDADRLVASLRPLEETDLAKLLEDAKTAQRSVPSEAEVRAMLDQARLAQESVLKEMDLKALMAEADKARAAVIRPEVLDQMRLQGEELRRGLMRDLGPDSELRRQIDEMAREMPGRMGLTGHPEGRPPAGRFLL